MIPDLFRNEPTQRLLPAVLLEYTHIGVVLRNHSSVQKRSEPFGRNIGWMGMFFVKPHVTYHSLSRRRRLFAIFKLQLHLLPHFFVCISHALVSPCLYIPRRAPPCALRSPTSGSEPQCTRSQFVSHPPFKFLLLRHQFALFSPKFGTSASFSSDPSSYSLLSPYTFHLRFLPQFSVSHLRHPIYC